MAPVIDPTIVPIKEAVLRPLLPPPELLLSLVEVGVVELALVEVASAFGDAEVVGADIDARDADISDVMLFVVKVEPMAERVEMEEVCSPDADETSICFNDKHLNQGNRGKLRC